MAISRTCNRKGLLIFRYNLRVQDNLALRRLMKSVEHLDSVFVIDPLWIQGDGGTSMPTRHGYRPKMGEHRKRFLWQSLYDLREQLEKRGSTLTLMTGDFVQSVALMLTRGAYGHVGLTDHPGHYEQQQLAQLRQRFSGVTWHITEDFTLFREEQLPFELCDLPGTFSQFRKRVEGLLPDRPRDILGALPPRPRFSGAFSDPVTDQKLVQALIRWQRHAPEDESIRGMLGGESSALDQLNGYIHGNGAIRHYKETRNELYGWSFSSKLSPWLAQGCLSPRLVYHEVLRHEDRFGRNESTQWLLVELLWREYFQWMAKAHGARMFRLRGIQGINPLQTFYPEGFMAWREGNTNSRFVNAFMKQLKTTGWMSNRGRQVVASYLVNELGIDWRYGAAWFEEMLIDYDCASNWGNWQYLAGVGADPRGKRRFNIDKQQAQYDPDGRFVDFWLADDDQRHAAGYAGSL
ncbi:MAG: DASH family cryptochrome [Ketobacteraceae bacterium]|nr:DASH family cryptochrome [Ketobacteraceae bacterium]